MIKSCVDTPYFFSVEGWTEKWYLDWLLKKINSSNIPKYKVNIYAKVEKNPEKFVKSLSIINNPNNKSKIWHVCDYEKNDILHSKRFKKNIDLMRSAENLGKQITYKLCYTNLTFELWLILHKTCLNKHIINPNEYLKYINSYFKENFKSLDEYKEEKNFKRILTNLDLNDVKTAICNAKTIMNRNIISGLQLIKYKKENYYEENPSLSIYFIIEEILNECEY